MNSHSEETVLLNGKILKAINNSKGKTCPYTGQILLELMRQ